MLLIANLLNRIKSESGSVAIVALVVMVLLGALGATLIKQSSTRSMTSANYADGIGAQYLAEAGIQHAKAEIVRQNYPGSVNVTSLTNQRLTGSTGSYSVTISFVNNIYTITSIGTVNNARRQVIRTFLGTDIYRFAVYGGENNGENLFSFVLNRGVSIYPSVNVVGDVGCNTNIDYGAYVATASLFGPITIDGNVVAHGDIVRWPGFSDGVQVTGSSLTRQQERSIPEVISLTTVPTVSNVAFPNNAASNTLLASVRTNITFFRPLDILQLFPQTGKIFILADDNTYYNNGNLALSNNLFAFNENIQGRGTILVNGNLKLESGTTVTNDVIFTVNGEVAIDRGSRINTNILLNATNPARDVIFDGNVGGTTAINANRNVSVAGVFAGTTSINARGNVTIDGTLTGATVINSNGDVVINGTLNGVTTITARGRVTINGTLGAATTINADGDVTLTSNSTIQNDITINSMGNVEIDTDTPALHDAILHLNGEFNLPPFNDMRGDTLVMARGRIWVGTGIGFNSQTTFPAHINSGILLANGNIFINNCLGNPLNGSVISRKTVTLYGNADVRHNAALVTKMRRLGLP